MTLAQTRTFRPTVASTSSLCGPMTLPSPIDVAPRRMTSGSRVTSVGEIDIPVEVDRRRVAHRHAVAHVGLVEADAQAPFGGGELGPVVDAVEAAVVLEADRAHDATVLAGQADELGQVDLAGHARGLERLDPPRSHSASKAYRPALISLPSSSSGVASFASTIRSTVP